MLSRIGAVILFCLMITGSSPMASEVHADVSRVMVLPFDGAAGGDFKYLTDSVRTMISSRLAAKPGVEVVDYTLTAEELSALHGAEAGAGSAGESIFTKFKVDGIISGALYSLQTGLKIQVTLNKKVSAPIQEGVFTALAVNEEHIIPSVEELVDEIVARGLGAQSEGALLAEMQSAGKEGAAGFSTEHPEKTFKKGLYGGAIIAESNMKVESLGVRRSSELPLMIVSMVTGDLDNDGTLEIVAASRTGVEIYRFDETLSKKLAEYSFAKTYKIHAVNIADLDNDGKKEIYVSANNNIAAASAIFSWSAPAGLRPIMTGIDYYIRPVKAPADGWILAGQRGSRDAQAGYMGKNIVKLSMAAESKELTEEKVLPLPRNIRLFDFVWADLDGNGVQEVVSIDRHDKLLVYDANNSLLWVSDNDYGGSRNFIGPAKSSVSSVGDLFGKNDNVKFEQQTIYVPTRLLVEDIDKDGSAEIIVGNNKRTTPKWFSNFREYDGGSVVCLSWRDSKMLDVWKTNTVTGYLADYTFLLAEGQASKASGNATNLLYIAQIPDKQTLGFSFSSDSKLLKYELNILTN